MLRLEKAQLIIEGAIAKAMELQLKPLSIFVLDARGAVKAAVAQDGTSLRRNDVALAKASGALGLGVSSRKLEAMAKERPHFMDGLTATLGNLVPVAGGVLVEDDAGRLVGAVGISGDTSDNDEAAAVAGIEKAGFKAVI